MGIYLKLFFQGVLKKAFWADRIKTFKEMISHPADYFSNIGKKDNDTNAYLLGMASTFLTWIVLDVVYVLTFGLFTFGKALLFLPVMMVVEFVGWIIGQYLLYYAGAWAFGMALKWLTGKSEIAKIRPILFSIGIAGITSVVPGFGSLLSAAIFILLLVIAYENALKVERGPAVGSAVLGTVMLAVVMGLPFWLIGFLFMAGYSAIALLFYHTPTYKDVSTKEAPAIVSSPVTPTTGVVAQTTPMVSPPAQVAVASPTARPVQQPASKPVAKKKKSKKPAQTVSATEGQAQGNQDNSSASNDSSQPAQVVEAQPTPTHTDVVDDAADAAKKALGF